MPASYQQVRSIQCTQCAAPLELFGGHKVETITCSYCGSILDPHDEYAVLKAHRLEENKRDYLPLKLGDTGVLHGVPFTIIGLVQYVSEPDMWTDFCLFSPTHGYAWLSFDAGHFTLSRRERDLPRPSIPWAAFPPKRGIELGDAHYKFFDSYQTEVVDVAGELPWRAEVGDKGWAADAISPPYVLSQERNGSEVEYFLGEYLDQDDVIAAFDIKKAIAAPRSVYLAQPFNESRFMQAMGSVAKKFAPLVLLATLLLFFIGSGDTVLKETLTWQQVSNSNGVQTQSFNVDDPSKLYKLAIRSPVDNSWVWMDIDLLQNGEPVFAVGKEISYYHGSSGGESWSEGSKNASVLFKVPKAGSYNFSVQVSEKGGYRYARPVTIKVKEGVILARWFMLLSVVSFLLLAWPSIRKFLFESRRWAPVTGGGDD